MLVLSVWAEPSDPSTEQIRMRRAACTFMVNLGLDGEEPQPETIYFPLSSISLGSLRISELRGSNEYPLRLSENHQGLRHYPVILHRISRLLGLHKFRQRLTHRPES